LLLKKRIRRRPAAPGAGPNYKGAGFNSLVMQAIVLADRIVISEHSYEFDGVDMHGKGSPQPRPVVVYAERTLSEDQKAMFVGAAGSTPPSAHAIAPVGEFVARHTIRFYKDGRLTSTMQICFSCKQIRWDGDRSAPPPDDMIKSLKLVVRNVGLTPERDWNSYAELHRQTGGRQ
jgi:hypothetical protein